MRLHCSEVVRLERGMSREVMAFKLSRHATVQVVILLLFQIQILNGGGEGSGTAQIDRQAE